MLIFFFHAACQFSNARNVFEEYLNIKIFFFIALQFSNDQSAQFFLRFSPWLPGEPNNNGTNKNFVIGRGHTQEQVGEDCLAMRHRKSLEDKTDSEGNPVTPYGADDVDCDVKMDCFICTRPAGTLHDYELCPQGWSFYKGKFFVKKQPPLDVGSFLDPKQCTKASCFSFLYSFKTKLKVAQIIHDTISKIMKRYGA